MSDFVMGPILVTAFFHFFLSLSHHSPPVFLSQSLSPQLLLSQHSCHQAVSANQGAADDCASDHYPDLPLH